MTYFVDRNSYSRPTEFTHLFIFLLTEIPTVGLRNFHIYFFVDTNSYTRPTKFRHLMLKNNQYKKSFVNSLKHYCSCHSTTYF